MKRNLILFTLIVAFGLVSFSSCDFEDPYKPVPTIDPVEPLFYFVFDEYGVPHSSHFSIERDDEAQKNIREQLIGHGWEWEHTYEISENGYNKYRDFYKDMIGLSPKHYFFKSDSEVVRYYYADHIPDYVFDNSSMSVDYNTGRILLGAQGQEQNAMEQLEVFLIYNVADTWCFVAVEYLGVRFENGESKRVWGVSMYKQMTEERLKEVQERYSRDVLK